MRISNNGTFTDIADLVFAEMSSGRSWPSLGGDKEPPRPASSGGDVIKVGYLKKLKVLCS